MATHEKQRRLGFLNIFYKSKRNIHTIPKPGADPNVVKNNPMMSPEILLPRKPDHGEEIKTTEMMSSPAISLPRNSDFYYGEETIKTMTSPMVAPWKSPNNYYISINGQEGLDVDDRPRRSLDCGGGRKLAAADAPRKSVSQVEANLASVVAFLQVKVLVTDMPGHMQVHAFRCARRTYDSLERFSSKHMAYNMKKEFDKVYGPAWHCIVGSSFGSFVTHSTGCFLYFTMEKLYVLVFKTKVQRALD